MLLCSCSSVDGKIKKGDCRIRMRDCCIPLLVNATNGLFILTRYPLCREQSDCVNESRHRVD